jgi:glycosyltransferase involved in cell wall biosynthesis
VTARLLHVFSTFVAGGPQVRTARLLPELAPDWRHALLSLDGRTDALGLLQVVEIELLAAPPRASTPRTALALARILRRERPDLLLTYNFGALDALLAGRMIGQRAVVHHEDGFRPDEVRGFKRRREWARRLVLPGTQGVVVPSFTLERIALERWKLPRARVHRIPNGIRAADFPPRDGNPARKRELGIPVEAPVVGFVGHLRPEKNPLRALATLARLARSDAHLLLLGDGPERAAVERRARELGLAARVHLAGHVADPRPDYRLMDAFLSCSDTEQMPVALLEALASALPVVATDVGDVRRILPDGTCVVPADEATAPAALARGLDELLADPALRARAGALGRARVEETFSFDGMVSAYRALYGRALAAARG